MSIQTNPVVSHLSVDDSQYRIQTEPYYKPIADEISLYEAAWEVRMPVMLKGPTGCGKTRFVEYMAYRLERPLITVACNEDMTASDLVRFALQALVQNRRRSALSLVGVVIGVVAVLSLTALGEGAIRYVDDQFASLGNGIVMVVPGKNDTTGGMPDSSDTRFITTSPNSAPAGLAAINPIPATASKATVTAVHFICLVTFCPFIDQRTGAP